MTNIVNIGNDIHATMEGNSCEQACVVSSGWPVDVGSVVDTDHAHHTLLLVDAQDDPVLAAPGAAEAF